MQFAFDSLPTELKLAVINYSDAITLTKLLQTNTQLRDLTSYVINNKISQITSKTHADEDQSQQNNLLISFYSPQNVEKKVELYGTKCLSNNTGSPFSASSSSSSVDLTRTGLNSSSSCESLPLLQKQGIDNENNDNDNHVVSADNLSKINDMLTESQQQEEETEPNLESFYSTNKLANTSSSRTHGNVATYSGFEIGSLVKTRNPLTKKVVNMLPQDQENYTTTTATPTAAANLPMNLLVDEDSSFIRLTIQLSLGNDQLFETLEILKKTTTTDSDSDSDSEIQYSIAKKAKFGFSYKLSKGDEVPPRSPYDYESLTNYYLDIEHFIVNNCYLLKCIEDASVLQV